MIRPHLAMVTSSVVLFLLVPLPGQEVDETGHSSGSVVRGAAGERLHDWLSRAAAFGLHAAVLVEQGGQVILCHGYGVAERGSGRPITWRTRFDIGSLAKQFTAAAVAEQVERGTLQWDSSLGELLPGVPDDKAAITVHQLLTHTAGLPYQPGRESLLAMPLQSPPGQRHGYSNVGYALLARVVEATSQRSLTEVTGELFARAGIPDVGVTGRPMDWDDQAHGYVDGFDFGTPEQLSVDHDLRGAGGYACTVGELHRWVRALERGSLFDSEIVERMLTDHVEGPAGYGYGWFILNTTRGTPLYRHMGTYNGFNSELRRYREEDRTIVFLSNTFVRGRALRDAVVNRIALQLAGQAVPEPPRVVAWDADGAEGYRGIYRSSAGTEIDVAVADRELFVSGTDQAGWSALFGVSGDPQADALVTSCAERSRELVAALRENARDEIEALANPGWVRAYRDLTSSWRRIESACGGVDSVAVLGTAVRDAAAGNAVTVVEATGGEGKGRFELVWTRRGALGSGTGGDLPGRRMHRVGDGRFAAFDLFSGIGVECEFGARDEGAAAWLIVRSGDATLRAERV